MSYTEPVAQQVYERAGFSKKHACELAGLYGLIKRINIRRVAEGRPDLLTLLQEERAKYAASHQATLA